MAKFWGFVVMIIVTQLVIITGPVAEAVVGVNYGMKGDNLPTPGDTINLMKSKGIQMVRLFEPNLEVLNALRFKAITVALGALDSDIPNFASSQQAAADWLNTNVIPFKNDILIKWITIGNEAIPGSDADKVLSAMQNMQNAVQAAGLTLTFVTTVVSAAVLGTSYPPSQGAFSSEVASIMTDIVTFVSRNGSPLMVNAYPYFAYISDPEHISLEYALFTATTPVVQDQGLDYYNIFDAIMDAFLAAVEKVGGQDNIQFVVSESGWPSAGNEPYTNLLNAETYNQNLKNHVSTKGTPKRSSVLLDTFIFALFNENQKDNAAEQNFGNFYPNMQPVYPLW